MKQTRLFLFIAMLTVASSSFGTDLTPLIPETYAGKADTLTTCLIRRFLNTTKGVFYTIPLGQSGYETSNTNIYWQQAHAMDVVIYSYQRVKDYNAKLKSLYKKYMERWYLNHANNWYHAENDETGFMNEYTDDMCWICLTLIHMSEALEDNKYIDMAKTIFDKYIEPRGYADSDGYWGLPWKLNNSDRNACTNAPGCLVAAKLYNYTSDKHYLDVAQDIYDLREHVMVTELNNDGRVEEPPLTYTQGTFGEACRQLYHITGDNKYMTMAQKVIWYAFSSTRCTHNNLLRHEGTSMDQSIFKAVLIPYAVNLALDEDCMGSYRRNITRALVRNANALWGNLDLSTYPSVYCNYYWGEPIDPTAVPSMGAMVSGASLMENVARLALKVIGTTGIKSINDDENVNDNEDDNYVYDLNGRKHSSLLTPHSTLPKGIYVIKGKKIVVR